MENQNLYLVLVVGAVFVLILWFLRGKIKRFIVDTKNNLVSFLTVNFNPKKRRNKKKKGKIDRTISFLLAFNFVFDWYDRKADTRIKETKKELKRQTDRREEWSSQSAGHNDNLSQITSAIKALRRSLHKLEQTQAESDNPKDFLERIKAFVDEIDRKEKRLEKLKIDFKNKYVSGIDIAEAEAKLEDAKMQKEAVRYLSVAWSIFFSLLVIPFLIFAGLSFFVSGWIFISCEIATLLLFAYSLYKTFKKTYQTVPEKEEWVIEFFGEYLVTWTSGLHFAFPFFMERKAKVYKGDRKISLYMDSETRGTKKSALVDFTNTAAEVNVELFYRMFSSYRAVYNISDVQDAVSEKMEAGIRAYLGNKRIDDAIQERADIELRAIIIQNATEADVFPGWGVIITSLAVTDIILTSADEKVRAAKLAAEKELEIAEVHEKTAEVKKRIAIINGKAEGGQLKELAGASGLSKESAKDYKLQLEKFEAWKKAGVLIAGDSGSQDGMAGATIGAAAQVGSQAVSGSSSTKADDDSSDSSADDKSSKKAKSVVPNNPKASVKSKKSKS